LFEQDLDSTHGKAAYMLTRIPPVLAAQVTMTPALKPKRSMW
jgi:monoamine oxidase